MKTEIEGELNEIEGKLEEINEFYFENE